MTRTRLRLAYLTNIPTPYRRDMIVGWAAENPDIAITVFYTDQDDQGRGWTTPPVGGDVTEQRLKPGLNVPGYGKLNRGLLGIVSAHDIIMIGGFEQAGYLATALLARAAGKPVLLLFDGFSPARFGREPRSALWLKRLTGRLANGFFANGKTAARYLREQLGVSRHKPLLDQRLSHMANPIAAARQRWLGMSRQQVQHALALPATDRPMILSCGYLIERKRIDLTIDAIAALPAHIRPELLIVGTGPLSDMLAERASLRGVSAHFVGFRQPHELANYYFAADALVLSSVDDPWGLVINEAMDAGLPVIVSDACGAAADLVQPATNGFVFASQDVCALSDAMRKLLAMDRNVLGAASRTIIAEWTPERSGRNLSVLIQKIRSAQMDSIG